MWQDELRNAVRHLRRARRFTLACVLTLTFALAASATLLNVFEIFVFRRLAVHEPDRLLGFYPSTGGFSEGFSASELQDLADRQDVLTGICGVTAGFGTLGVQLDGGPARQRPVEAVTGNCYSLLGIQASRGRLLEPSDAPLSGQPNSVVVISHRLWRESFGSAPDVVGRTLRLEGTPLEVVGVFPDSYRGVNADEAPDLAIPLSLPWTLHLQPPRVMHAVGRVRTGRSLREASVQLTALWPHVRTHSPLSSQSPAPLLRTEAIGNGFSALRERYRRPLTAVAGLTACLLLLACVNVGGLSVARLLDRRETFAVQMALGAGRGRLAAQVFAEAAVIGAAAALLALPLARWGSLLVVEALWTGERPMTIRATPFATTLLLTAGAAMLSALLIAVPGWIALASHAWTLDARAVSPAGRRGPRRKAVGMQLGLGLALAFAAVLLGSDLLNLTRLPLGFEVDRLAWVRLDRSSRSATVPTVGYLDVVLARVEAIPGVSLAAASQSFGTTTRRQSTLEVSVAGAGTPVHALMDRVSPSFFRAAGIPLQRGRTFRWNDVGGPAVTILNQSLADRLFPDGNVIGRTVHWGTRQPPATVVGVVADATPGDPRLQGVPQYYLPLSADAPPAPVLLVRHNGRALTLPDVAGIVEPLAHHEVLRVSSMAAQANRFLAPEMLLASTTAWFAGLSLVISLAGLYATMSEDVARRRREIGIRIAVGATPARIRQLLFVELGWTVALGLCVGIPASLGAAYLVRSLLSWDALEPVSLLLGTTLAVGAAALLVSIAPVRRAVHTPVMAALRTE